MVRGLDDDEAGFLDFVDQTKLAEESRILQEERNELEEYRKAVIKENEERLRTEVKSIVQLTKPGQSLLPSIGVSKEKSYFIHLSLFNQIRPFFKKAYRNFKICLI